MKQEFSLLTVAFYKQFLTVLTTTEEKAAVTLIKHKRLKIKYIREEKTTVVKGKGLKEEYNKKSTKYKEGNVEQKTVGRY